MEPFLILGMPRCRTAWLAEFLSRPERICLHEPSKAYCGLADLEAALASDKAAISDSMLTLRWREILRQRPHARIVVVHRPIVEVVRSFGRLGLFSTSLPGLLQRLEEERLALQQHTRVMSVSFASMAEEAICAGIYRWCHHLEVPAGHWERWAQIQIQANVAEMMRVVVGNQTGIAATFPELEEFG